MNHKAYLNLLRTIAEKHVDIQHSDSNMAFVRVVLNTNPMLSAEAQIGELLESLKFELSSRFMLVETYEGDYRHMNDDNPQRLIAGAFHIYEELDRGDADAEENIFNKTEQICEEVYGYLTNHYEENPEQGFFEWKNTGTQKISSITDRQFSGTRATFGIIVPGAEGLTYNPDKFV